LSSMCIGQSCSKPEHGSVKEPRQPQTVINVLERGSHKQGAIVGLNEPSFKDYLFMYCQLLVNQLLRSQDTCRALEYGPYMKTHNAEALQAHSAFPRPTMAGTRVYPTFDVATVKTC
jgi:hypothetical protein